MSTIKSRPVDFHGKSTENDGMKKIFTIIIFAFTLSGCANNDTKHVDIKNEMETRPGLILELQDGTEIPGFEGNYCTDVLCMETPTPDFSALTFTAIPQDSVFSLKVDTTYEIASISGSLFKKDGSEFSRNMEFIATAKYVYTPAEELNKDESEITLHVSVIFVDQGRTNYYFPIKLQ